MRARARACMCVCVCVCDFVCIHTYVCAFMRACICLQMRHRLYAKQRNEVISFSYNTMYFLQVMATKDTETDGVGATISSSESSERFDRLETFT